jgi:undecaprenyl-phosphate 4-deoxy-4-formamido-L-arabinose transferase
MNDSPLELSIVIPCYFAREFIAELVEEVHREVGAWCPTYEVILVNDGSTDGTWEVLLELQRRAPERLRCIDLMRNFGQHNALYVGITHARYDVVVTMDDDLQHPPGAIASLADALTPDVDLVYGVPKDEQHGLWRDAASIITKWAFEKGLGIDFASDTSAFRLFRRNATTCFGRFTGSFVDIDALLCWHTQRVSVVEVEHRPRPYGESSYTFVSLVGHALKMVTLFTTVPLRIISVVGFTFALFGMGVFGYVMLSYLVFGSVVQGFTFLASITALFAGAQLFSIGVLGEYLSRVHFQTVGYPPAVKRHDILLVDSEEPSARGLSSSEDE